MREVACQDPYWSDRKDTDRQRRRRLPADASGARLAATLLLLYPGPDGELSLPLTVRQPDLRSHAGEVSLPGGAVDHTDASPTDAALREA